MKKILIAIDYSPAAQKVAEKGYALAKAMNSEIVLIHIIEDVTYYSSQSYDPIMGFGGFVNVNFFGPDIITSITEEAFHFLQKTKEYLYNTPMKLKVLHGDIDNAILEEAENEKCEIIVVGTNGRRGLEEFLLGSTAHKLLKNSKIPIYIIPTYS
jgi:nucleotide-binding universal stress UspA family protein